MLLTFFVFFALSLLARAATVCNGHAEYCSRPFSNVSQVGSHDSAFVGDLPTQNQHLSVTAQLQAGIRFLQGQTHKNILGTLDMCHTSCFEEDAGSLESYMSTVKTWLDGNPNEVLMMLLVNGDNVAPSVFDSALSSSGINKYVFTPSTGSGVLPINQWPTLGTMITNNTRLVLFLDTGANTTQYPYILDEFSYFFETPYDTTDPNFPECTLDRPTGANPAGRMYIVNHFLDVNIASILIPDEGAANQTNAATGAGSIGAQTAICEGLYGHAPKGVLVDYMDQGNVFVAQANLNGVSAS